MDYILQTKGLSKTYRRAATRAYALAGVDMRVLAGSVYRLAGKNGSGKTTLMRLVVGFASPQGGSFILYGAARKKIGTVIEPPTVYPMMNAWDNLSMQCRIKGVSDTACIRELLETVGLTNTGKKRRMFCPSAIVNDEDNPSYRRLYHGII